MSAPPAPEKVLANGLNAVTGGYLLEPQTPAEVAKAALAEHYDPDYLREMQCKASLANTPTYAPVGGLDAANLADVGWGVVLHAEADPKVLEPLRLLLDLRKQQAGPYYRELTGPDGYRPGDTHLTFLTRLGAGPGPADPEKVPYYLLLVGGPEEIPFEFQYQLDIQYGVGRVHFDTAGEYAAYAAGVVAGEASALRPRRAGFFATANPDDKATRLSADLLVDPLQKWTAAKFPNWDTEAAVGGAATKARLASLLGGNHTPALLFTASHGLALPQGHARQLNAQGALVCQEWPGPLDWRQEIAPNMTFGADDFNGDVRGLVAFIFACFGAGTPRLDDYPRPELTAQPTLADRPFVARLPRRLLASGALAVVGHIDRGWPYSFLWQNNSQLAVFQGMLRLLLKGQRVGWALDQFNVRHSELAAALSEILGKVKYGFQPDPLGLSYLWMAHNDARGFVVLGDPAVRLSAVTP
jgi:hypothetical protein